MNAGQLTDKQYGDLVKLPYSRKINNCQEARHIDCLELDPELLSVIQSFPEIHIDHREDLLGVDTLDGNQQFYLLQNDTGTYLIDTQGYNYPRYIVKLIHLDLPLEPLDYMDGMIRLVDEQIFNSVISSMVSDLRKEGDFSKKELLEFLQYKVDLAFDQIKFL